MTTTLLWFRRDLRLSDNPALVEAIRSGDEVVGAFCLDPALLDPAGNARRSHLFRSLAALDQAMGGNLVVRSGDPADVIPELAIEIGAASVHLAEDFGPYGRRRDAAVAERVVGGGMELVRTGSPYAVPPGSITTKAGSPYKVFTPFSRAWRDHGWPAPGRRPSHIPWRRVASEPIPGPPDTPGVDLPAAGEDAARERLGGFLGSGVQDYDQARNAPAADATSRLSPDLKWGAIHPRQILARLGGSRAEQTFAKELCWREFHADVLFHRPESARQSMDPAVGAMPWDHGRDADELFEAWAQGRTGYPIVDAGMRQMLGEGWMHNRVRMITASFFVKDLHLDWQRGARWFMQQLVDGDLASNQHGWQWTAGTGTDAAPFFRIFNPTTQGERFDPHGTYVRRWVPELASVPTQWIHRPAEAPDGLAEGYPPPVVDHAEERAESLRRYEATR